ncbi:hypothetical protein Ciccas_012476 [Cichlidogyrus casuarinus]|uniref:Uncharacterized protein n=1 Tax=Cichlidogyrus casuarinus TaxID=1844966 RepID=A0ABD2PN99_9PLAT
MKPANYFASIDLLADLTHLTVQRRLDVLRVVPGQPRRGLFESGRGIYGGSIILSKIYDWFCRLRPWKHEIAHHLRLNARMHKALDLTRRPMSFRYFVRFPYLSDHEFGYWNVASDATFHQGFSRVEFIRSHGKATGATPNINSVQGPRVGSDSKPLDLKRRPAPTYPDYDPRDNTISLARDRQNAHLRTYGIDQ